MEDLEEDGKYEWENGLETRGIAWAYQDGEHTFYALSFPDHVEIYQESEEPQP